MTRLPAPRRIDRSNMRHRPELTAPDVRALAEACREEASRQDWAVTISIVDAGGHLLHLERLDSRPSTVAAAIGKARTVALMQMPSGDLERAVTGNPALLALDALPLRGALPLRWGGAVLGAIGVSGVKPEQDEQVARRGVERLATMTIAD
jgi:glc operon protein GlcG